MKAIQVFQFGDENELKYSDAAMPIYDNKQLLIDVKSAGINPVETYVRSGQFPVLPKLPYIPGSDAAGIVKEVGKDVTRFKPGDKVYTTGTCSGGYATFLVADEDSVHLLHSSLSFQQGACLGIPYYTAYRALVIRGHAKPGESVLIHGASGAVGVACCQIAKDLGLKVYGTAGTQPGLDLVKNNGAIDAFNHRTASYMQDIQKVTGGVDIIVEMFANVNLSNDLDLLNRNGRLMVVGSRGTVEFDPMATVLNEVDIRGLTCLVATPREIAAASEYLYKLAEKGGLNPVVGKEYSLAEASQAHVDILNNKATSGNIVFTIN